MMIELFTMVLLLTALTSLNPCSNGMMIELTHLSTMVFGLRCLNPCSNGMMIEPAAPPKPLRRERLNPCSNGMMIEPTIDQIGSDYEFVLILVLMEY